MISLFAHTPALTAVRIKPVTARNRTVRGLIVIAFAVAAVYSASAQAPLAFPYTMTTLAGTSPMSSTVGTQCPNLPTGVKSTDAYGDGCLAVNGIFGAGARGGVQVDAAGNVFISDDINGLIHVVNPSTGIMTVFAGKGTVCSTGKLTSAGDGCVAATQTVLTSQRGIGLDYYGNVFSAGYGDNLLHMVCRTVSPNCTSAQIGTMQVAAGCSNGTGSSGSGGFGNNNVPAVTLSAGTCTSAKGEVGAPRGAWGDQYGNVYWADTNSTRYRVSLGPQTSSFFSGSNPLYTALALNYGSLTQGYAYTVVNVNGTCSSTYTVTGPACGGALTVAGANCATGTGTTAPVALDTIGDGCPFQYSSLYPSSGYTSAITTDGAGNVFFTDPTEGLRVLYVSGSGTAGALTKNAIQLTNPSITPTVGYVYMLAGNVHGVTGTNVSTTPTLGTSTIVGDSTTTKITISPQGYVLIGDSGTVLLFDLNTGYIRTAFAGSSNVTAGNYCTGSAGQKSLSAYSDGCAATQSKFANSNGLGIAADTQGNAYLFDSSSNGSGMLVRKVLAQDLAATTVGTALIQSYRIHVPATGAGTVSAQSATLTTSPDVTVTTPLACGTQNADFSFDCTVAVTATPVAPGPRSSTLTVTVPVTVGAATTNSVFNLALAGTAAGSSLAVDSATNAGTAIPPTTNALFSGITPAGVAVDGAGNVYTMDTSGSHFLEYVLGAGSATIAGTLPATPSQIAVDQLGNIYAVGSGTSSITELAVSGPPASAGAPAAFTATSVVYTPTSGTATPKAIAVDIAGNLFVADKQASTANTNIYRISMRPNSGGNQLLVGTGFTNPVSLAVDPSGNVYVADSGVPAVYKLTPPASSTGVYTQSTVTLTGVTPAAVATDAAGDLYVQDSAHGTVILVPGAQLSTVPFPSSFVTTTVQTGITTPVGLAADGLGNVYSADSGKTSITQIVRDAVTFNFGTGSSGSPTYAATITNVGNTASTGQNPVTNTTNFSVVAGTTNGCTASSNVLGAQAAGNACTITANFVGNGAGPVSDAITYLPAASTTGSLTLSGTLSGTAIATTTTVGGQTPASPNYSPTGTEVTFTVTVTAASGSTAPGGTVAVTVDSTTTNPTLVANGTSGVATVTLTGLTAGTHSISAIYSTSGSFTGSNSGTAQNFSVAQDTTTTSWTPGATSVAYSAPISTAILNATASFGGSTVPGVFVYTANGSEVNAATYLAQGTYTLGVTFYPTDSVDYTSSTASGGTLTVNKASTTAGIGSTQNLVAADGTGNYTTVQSAVNALPSTGGKIYIKPGTYTGFVTVVIPNVGLYGLGGNPSNVIITNEDGAFSSPFLPGQGTGNNGNSGDAGSSTMLVERAAITGVYGGATFTPYNFYAENMSIINSYDTDPSNSNPNYYISGSCVGGNAGLPNGTLYNGAGTTVSPGLCNSQALAIWITADQSVLNNVYTASLQDTIYAGSISGSSGYAARQYWFRGKVTGDVDYIFGDAAAVFDHTSIYTTYHGTGATGTETIEAQNKASLTGSASDYLSGYVMNSDVFTSQSSGMTNLYFGRPYGHYSTWAMLNSYVDQVANVGYIEFSGDTNLPTSTYVEYNNHVYTDPANGSADLNGVTYLGTGGSAGSGALVNGTSVIRETSSTNPGTVEVANSGFQTSFPTLPNTTLSQIEAQQYYPIAFLGTTVASNPYNNGVTNWNPTTAIATGSNGFVGSGSSATVAANASVTLLMRPQTPGLGAVANGTYTIPTGTYTLFDSGTQIATGTLDGAGEAYYISSSLAAGTHNLTWTYSGDSNFSGSTTSSAYVLTVTGTGTTTTLSAAANPIVYGQSASITATVSPASGSGTPTGTVTLTTDSTSTQNMSLTSGTATFGVTGLLTGGHTFGASYGGGGGFTASSTASNLPFTVTAASLTATGSCANRIFGQVNNCTAGVTGYQYSDTAATVFTGTPTGTTTATRNSVAGPYAATALGSSLTETTFGSTNYTVAQAGSNFTISGGAAQQIIFPALPAFPHGASYQLSARTTSGLPVTYAVTAGGSIASVSGTTLTVTGTGQTVTVQASQTTDATGDYAAATSVSQSFTPQ